MAATARQRKQAASRAGRRFLLIGALTVAALAGPSVASAASCLGSAGSTTLTLTLASGEAARVFVQGALIRYGNLAGTASATCRYRTPRTLVFQDATTTNTDTINAVGVASSTTQQTFRIDLAGGPFAPGATTESSGLSEIEFTVNLGDGPDLLAVNGTSATDRIAFATGAIVGGSSTIALNNDTDADVTTNNNEAHQVYGNAGSDSITGGGTHVLSFARSLYIDGGDGYDTLIGGRNADTIIGGLDDDNITGGAGNDTQSGGDGNDRFLSPSPDGADTILGGLPTVYADTIDYSGRTNAVTVNLDALRNDGETGEGDYVGSDGGVENVTGGAGGDMITGNAGNNLITGGAGNDRMSGAGGDDLFRTSSLDGADTMSGEVGNDTLDYSGRTNPLIVSLYDLSANDG